MTQKQKAEAYDEAFEEAKNIHRFSSNIAEIKRMEDLFLELKESEDERIRKAIGYAIGQSTHSDGTLINGVSSEEALAWLEKQDEQKPYGQREECLDCQVNYAGECKGSCELKRNEQKPIWSEEDENVLEDIEEAIINYWHGDTQDILLDWLKSIKERIGE